MFKCCFFFYSQAEAMLLRDVQHFLLQFLTRLSEYDWAGERDGPLILPLILILKLELGNDGKVNDWAGDVVSFGVLVNRGQSCPVLLTCRMTPMACLWLSNRAGEGGAGSSASVDILSRMVPVTRVLDTQSTHTICYWELYYCAQELRKWSKRRVYKMGPRCVQKPMIVVYGNSSKLKSAKQVLWQDRVAAVKGINDLCFFFLLFF